MLLDQVRVPAPCQYAHKLALLVGDALHKVAMVSSAFFLLQFDPIVKLFYFIKVPSPTGEMDDLLYFL